MLQMLHRKHLANSKHDAVLVIRALDAANPSQAGEHKALEQLHWRGAGVGHRPTQQSDLQPVSSKAAADAGELRAVPCQIPACQHVHT
jgi:hypothetical protein